MNLRETLTANLQLKLLSLLFALFLWVFVTLEGTGEIEIPLEVKVANIPPGLSLKNQQLGPLSIRLSGPRILLVRQQFRGAATVIDLSGAVAGRRSLSGLDLHVQLEQGIKPVRVLPATMDITLVPAAAGGGVNQF